MNYYHLFNLIILLFVIITTFVIYSYKICGAADGKIFIGFSLLFLSLNNENGLLNYSLNTIILYTITMLAFSLLVTNVKSKKKVLRKIRYVEHFFFTVSVFLIGFLIYLYVYNKTNYYITTAISILLFVMILLTKNKIKNFLRKQNKKLLYIINILMVLIFLIISNNKVINYLILALIAKILIEFISKLTLEIKEGKKTYESPFAIYLVFGALLTLIIKTNFFLIVAKFF